jgi:hypothetical protein
MSNKLLDIVRTLNLFSKNAKVDTLHTRVLYVNNTIPLIDPNTGKINTLLLPLVTIDPSDNSKSSYQNFGKYTKRDISCGCICLDVSEDGSIVTLYKDDIVFKTLTKKDVNLTDTGMRHEIDKGLYYTLTNTENIILEVNAKLVTGWCKDSATRKYILTKSPKK